MWFKKVNDSFDKDKRIIDLQLELSRMGNALADEREKIRKIQDAVRSSSFEFDFKAVKVFSVERNMKDGAPCTIIGYLLPEPIAFDGGVAVSKEVIREWYLYCDDKQHESIVKAFKDSRK